MQLMYTKMTSSQKNHNVSFGSVNLIPQLQFRDDFYEKLEDLHLMLKWRCGAVETGGWTSERDHGPKDNRI